MRLRHPVTILIAAAAVSGCTAAPLPPRGHALPRLPRVQASRVSVEMARAALDTTASQVRRCYRSPRVASAGRQIVTRLRIRVSPEGVLGGIPQVIEQSNVHPGNQNYAARMAEAAIMSVIQCAPYRLPAEFAGGEWVEIELTFSPSAAV